MILIFQIPGLTFDPKLGSVPLLGSIRWNPFFVCSVEPKFPHFFEKIFFETLMKSFEICQINYVDVMNGIRLCSEKR